MTDSLPSLSEYEQMSALEQRRTLAPYDDKVEQMERDRREALAEKKKRDALEKRLYLEQNFTPEIDIKDTDYPSFAKPGEKDKYADAHTGPFDPEQWGPDGRWWEWNRYSAVREAVPLQTLFK